MNPLNWSQALAQAQQRGEAHALVTVLGCTGSTPRDQASKMLVSAEQSYDSIGGGHLEFVVINKARELLAQAQQSQLEANNYQQICHFPLGASLGQCCGGSASVLIEIFAANPYHIAVFGAGHVAKALIKILAELPCRVSWIDQRQECFPEQVPTNIQCILSDQPSYELESLAAGSDVLILTHNHQLDFELCIKALEHRNLRHIGLIGSQTKAQRFAKRLEHRGFSSADIRRIICPVGKLEVEGKLPMQVAVSIAAQLIEINAQTNNDTDTSAPGKQQHRGLAWKTIKNELGGEVDNSETGYVLRRETQDVRRKT